MAMMPAMLLMAAATAAAGPPFETPAPATVATPATVSAAFWAPAPAAAIAIPSAASKRPLETGARIAATDASGLAWKFTERFKRSAGICNPRAGFARQQNYTVVHKRWGLANFLGVFFMFVMCFVSFVSCVDFDV